MTDKYEAHLFYLAFYNINPDANRNLNIGDDFLGFKNKPLYVEENLIIVLDAANADEALRQVYALNLNFEYTIYSREQWLDYLQVRTSPNPINYVCLRNKALRKKI